jgi:DNA-binding winged helix-turn-helix (wHTH) protein
VSLDLGKREVRRAGRLIDLTPRELALLDLFLRRPEIVLSRTVIGQKVFGLSFDPGTNVVDVYVTYLRKKLAEAGPPPSTVRGAGYVLRQGAREAARAQPPRRGPRRGGGPRGGDRRRARRPWPGGGRAGRRRDPRGRRARPRVPAPRRAARRARRRRGRPVPRRHRPARHAEGPRLRVEGPRPPASAPRRRGGPREPGRGVRAPDGACERRRARRGVRDRRHGRTRRRLDAWAGRVPAGVLVAEERRTASGPRPPRSCGSPPRTGASWRISSRPTPTPTSIPTTVAIPSR